LKPEQGALVNQVLAPELGCLGKGHHSPGITVLEQLEGKACKVYFQQGKKDRPEYAGILPHHKERKLILNKWQHS
jgi:hypothetical protein